MSGFPLKDCGNDIDNMKSKKSLNQFASEVLKIMPLMVREFARRENNDLTRGKISCPQMVALHHAVQHQKITVSEIAKLLNINKSSASVLVGRLVRQKLMARSQDKNDRRVVWVSITSRGRQVVSQIMNQKHRSLKAIFGRLTEKERDQYLSALLKVKAHLVSSCAVFLVSITLFSSSASAFWFFQGKENKKTVETSAKISPPAENSQNQTLSLQEAFQKSLKRSEKVAITAEEINQAQARFYRAFDYFLPTVSFQMTRFYQDIDNDSPSSSGFGNSQRPNTPEKKFVFSQPLFSGFKEIAALQGSGADKKQQTFAWQRAKELLFMDVMEAFYTVLNAEKDLEVLLSTHELLAKRLEELEGRVKLGRSRDSEMKTSVADLKIIEAGLVSAKNKVRVTRNLLEYYLAEGLEGVKLEEGNEMASFSEKSVSMETLASRSDVLSDEQGYIVVEKAVVAANADLFPKISLAGEYFTQRVGFQKGNDWDMTLKFDVPIFEVGQTLGDIKEAVSSREQARLKFQQTKRLAELDIRNAVEEFRAARASEVALDAANQASKENYDILSKEYSMSLVNNLQVLDALRRYQDIERSHHEAHFNAQKNYWRLRVAEGDVPGVDS